MIRTCQRNHSYDNNQHRTCPLCKVEYRKSYYAQNKEKERANTAVWLENNRESYLASKRANRSKEDEAKWYQNRLRKRKYDSIWRGMLKRCYEPTHHKYPTYGALGVKVYAEWHDEEGYFRFESYIGERPSPLHTVDRIKTNGNYEPGNVRWATKKEQQRNRRVNALVTIEGKTQCIAAWCEEYGIKQTTFSGRLKHGWTGLSLLNKPNRNFRQKRNMP